MRPAVKLLLLLMAAHGSLPRPALAFSADGHRVVGAIAESHLCAPAHAWLAPLLDGSDLASAGVWADAVRDDPLWAQSAPWHYINVTDDEGLRQAAARSGDAHVLAALERFERELADTRRSIRERGTALRFFVHFVADVHQPLHVGRSEDRGGNDVHVRWGRADLNLHELWDGRALIVSEGLAIRDLASATGALAIGQMDAWATAGPLQWAEESRRYRGLVYGFDRRRSPAQLSAAYVTAARNVVNLRLAQAGVRLAARLNRLACPEREAGAPSR